MVLESPRAHVGAMMRAPGLHVGAGDEEALGAAQRERARRLRQLDVEAAQHAEAHAAPDEGRLERGAGREHCLLAVEEMRLVVGGEQLAVRREDDGGVVDGTSLIGRRSGSGRAAGREIAEARQAGDEAHTGLAGHPPERLETPSVQGLRERAHALGREPGEDVLGSATGRAPSRAAAATAAPAAARFSSLSPSTGRSWARATRRGSGWPAADMAPSYRRHRDRGPASSVQPADAS